MTVRRATLDDLPSLMAMATAEHGVSRLSKVPFDSKRAEQAFRHFIGEMSTVVFISANGFIMGMVQPLVFSRFWNAYEMAWYAGDGSGMELLAKFTQWASDMQAIEVVVHNYAGIVPDAKFTRVMKRKGFENLGCAYSKQVGEI